MLYIPCVLRDECGPKLRQTLAQLRYYLRPHQILHGLFGAGVGMDVDLKLQRQSIVSRMWIVDVADIGEG